MAYPDNMAFNVAPAGSPYYRGQGHNSRVTLAAMTQRAVSLEHIAKASRSLMDAIERDRVMSGRNQMDPFAPADEGFSAVEEINAAATVALEQIREHA
ncbi:hypothetical protein [Acetobacter sp. UBA5411]|uniref:hypothetical protein n=1 Tax=Acetobacter sp. UBA5411 TaxID=1945905 RepID=UPI0025C1B806|nr:hypothetical protein [Acetobacter sp. UBA5411]